jgi:hypothetical protein
MAGVIRGTYEIKVIKMLGSENVLETNLSIYSPIK